MTRDVHRLALACLSGLMLASGAVVAQPRGSSTGMRIALRLPRDLGMPDVALLAEGSIRLGKGAVIGRSRGKQGRSPVGGVVVNLGKGATVIDPGAQAGGVVAAGPVRVAAGAQIGGDIRGAGSVDVAAGAKVAGQAQADALLVPFVDRSWTVAIPARAKDDVVVAKGETRRLAPGSYRTLIVRDRGVLQLERGSYVVASLRVDGRGRLEHQGNDSWPVAMVVSGSVVLNGEVGREKGGTDFLLIAPGVSRLSIRQAFAGTVIATGARLALGGKGTKLRGAFVARDIDVLPGTILEAVPFALDTFQFKGWVSYKDEDRDGVPDYRDACPADGKKRVPGACGCGVPDENTDKDGIPDCLARLRRTDLPRCPSGKTCPPAESCRPFPWRESTYWYCADKTGIAQRDAQKACDRAGMALAEVESPEEGRFLARLLPAPAWVGGRAAKACRALDSADGAVIDAGCATRLGFVCQYRPRPPLEMEDVRMADEAKPCRPAAEAGLPLATGGTGAHVSPEAVRRWLADAKAGLAGTGASAANSNCCDEVELCAAEQMRPASFALSDPDGPSVVTAQALFPSGKPKLTWSTEYRDPPTGKGVDHAWCRMTTQDPASLSPVRLPGLGKSVIGRGEGGSITVTPDVAFTADPVPYPYGEVEPRLRGHAAFTVAAQADGFLGLQGSMELVKGTLEISATRCGLRAGMTGLAVLGEASRRPEYIPWIDSDDPASPLHGKAVTCERALRRFLGYADQAKKAFRDAQQLSWQLGQAGALDERPLARSIAVSAPVVEHFPGGGKIYNNERMEDIVGRFIYHYNPAGLGEAAGLLNTAHSLAEASADFGAAAEAAVNRSFAGEAREVTRTVATIPLAMAGIPLEAKIVLTVRYAIAGRFEVDWRFPEWIEGPPSGSERLLRVAVTAAPTLSASLGAVVELAPGYRQLGLAAESKGKVTLVDVTLPMVADAALDRQAFLDTRPLPADIREPVALADNDFVVGAPKRYRFTLAHEHGASVHGAVLDGDLAARLRVPLGSFERVFSLPMVRVQRTPGRFDLADAHAPSAERALRRTVPAAHDGPAWATRVVAGVDPVGISEAEVPLVFLRSVGQEHADVSSGKVAAVDLQALQRVFYDDLCRPRPGESCTTDRRAPPCQTFSTCVVPKGESQGVCEARCRKEQQVCKRNEECCQGLFCDWLQQCAPCTAEGNRCRADTDCCRGLSCDKKSRACRAALK